MSSPLFATFGDGVKLWDSTDFNLVRQFHPTNSADELVVDGGWNKRATHIACVLNKSHRAVISCLSPTSTSSSSQHCTVITDIEASCCSFCNTSGRYVAVGGSDGRLCMWDNNCAKIVKFFQGHETSVCCLSFRRGDSHLASAAARCGTVLMHNISSGVPSHLHVSAVLQNQSVRALAFSQCVASHVAATYTTGHVCVWDVNRPARPVRHVLHVCDAHVAPAASVCFSPVNSRFLASGGLDRRLVCYDLRSQTVVQRHVCGGPVTSLDMWPDGRRLAVGTSRGRVEIYDLMNLTQPVHTFTAHNSAVHRLRFQPTKSVGAGSDASSCTVSMTTDAELAVTTSVAGASQQDGGSVSSCVTGTPPVCAGDMSALEDVFSPLRYSSTRSELSLAAANQSTTTAMNSAVPSHSVTTNRRADASRSVVMGAGEDSRVFSPVRRSVLLDASDMSSSCAPASSVSDRVMAGSMPAGVMSRPPVCHSTPEELAAPAGVAEVVKRRSRQLQQPVMSPLAVQQPSVAMVTEDVDSGALAATKQTTDKPVDPLMPHFVRESFERLEDQIENVRNDLTRTQFQHQWSSCRELYELKTMMAETLAAVTRIDAEMQKMRQDIQQLAFSM